MLQLLFYVWEFFLYICRSYSVFSILSYKYPLEMEPHNSLLIDMGFSAVAIADRVGHESIEITYQYAYLFPSKQTEMADRLDDLEKGELENVS